MRPLIDANPERMLWGKDWPHTGAWPGKPRMRDAPEPFHPIDDGEQLNLLGKWATAQEIRRILVDNPQFRVSRFEVLHAECDITPESYRVVTVIGGWGTISTPTESIEVGLGSSLVGQDVSLLAKLEQTNRTDWLADEMLGLTSPSTYEQHPENAWERFRHRARKPRDLAVLMEVAAWREREAQSKDVPRSRVLKDDILIGLPSLNVAS